VLAETAFRKADQLDDSHPLDASRLPRLLILRCASRKLPGATPMPAIQRYDGPAFQILRKYLRAAPHDRPLVWIISAKYGLLTEHELIADYDQRMDDERAQKLRPSVLARVQRLVQEQPVRDVMLMVGKTYEPAVEGIEQVLAGRPIYSVGGTQGRQHGALRAWLYGEDAELTANRRARSQKQVKPVRQLQLMPTVEESFTLGGKRFTTSADEVLRVARQAIAEANPDALRIVRWYVPVDDQRIGPKWLVSAVSGVSPDAFEAERARSILQTLTVPVVDIKADPVSV
jgi:hypothetical protein